MLLSSLVTSECLDSLSFLSKLSVTATVYVPPFWRIYPGKSDLHDALNSNAELPKPTANPVFGLVNISIAT